MMKFFIIFGTIFNIIYLISIISSTKETNEWLKINEKLPHAGIKPGNLFYGVDKFFENVGIRLTISNKKKVERLSKIAVERLAELNALDDMQAKRYANQLFYEFGLNMSQAHFYMQRLVTYGKVNEIRLAKLEHRIRVSENFYYRLSKKAKESISLELKEQVLESIKLSKMSMIQLFEYADVLYTLLEEGYEYSVVLKLQAISLLSSKTIDELFGIEDILKRDEEGEYRVDFNRLLDRLQITPKQVREELRKYNTLQV